MVLSLVRPPSCSSLASPPEPPSPQVVFHFLSVCFSSLFSPQRLDWSYWPQTSGWVKLWPGRGRFDSSLLHLYTGTHCKAPETRQPPRTEKSHSPSTGCYALEGKGYHTQAHPQRTRSAWSSSVSLLFLFFPQLLKVLNTGTNTKLKTCTL